MDYREPPSYPYVAPLSALCACVRNVFKEKTDLGSVHIGLYGF